MKRTVRLLALVLALMLAAFCVACDKERDKIDGIDFILDFEADKDVRILQVADTQAMLYEGIREARRYNVHNAFFTSGVTDTFTRVWQYVEEGVWRSAPDLIVLTGDNIYGETDDSGVLWQEMIELFDSFGIPWLCVFGNHDNESERGVLWQIERVQASEYGRIARGSCTHGNSNYTVGIRQGGRLTRVLYMLDTNGCRVKTAGESMLPTNKDIKHITQIGGIFSDQLAWMVDCSSRIKEAEGEVPALAFMHIPPIEARTAAVMKYSDSYGSWPFRADMQGDAGSAYEEYVGFNDNGMFFSTAASIGVGGIFVGHQHNIATSICYNGMRITYGLKTGTGDYHRSDLLGTTLITLDADSADFSVEYLHTGLKYPI